MPRANLAEQLLESLQRLITNIEAGREAEELHEVQVHVVQPHDVEGQLCLITHIFRTTMI